MDAPALVIFLQNRTNPNIGHLPIRRGGWLRQMSEYGTGLKDQTDGFREVLVFFGLGDENNCDRKIYDPLVGTDNVEPDCQTRLRFHANLAKHSVSKSKSFCNLIATSSCYALVCLSSKSHFQ